MSICTIEMRGAVTLRLDFDLLMKRISVLENGDQFCLNLSGVSFINPEALIVLVTASKLAFERTQRPVVWDRLEPQVYSYLERLDVAEVPFVRLKKPSVAKKYHRAASHSGNLVELSTITDWKEIGNAIRKTRGVLNRWFPGKSVGYRNDLATLIKETVENSIDHSGEHPKEGTCYYVVQKYEHQDGKVEIQIAVGDVGVGMLSSLRRVFPETKNDADAIVGALVEGKSGRITGGGLGYLTIKEALANLKGSLTIRSGTAIVQYSSAYSRPRIYRQKTNYPGTQIIFRCGA